MDDLTKLQLEQAQKAFDQEAMAMDNAQFKAGNQDVYISNYRMVGQKDGRAPMLIIDIEGGEEKNRFNQCAQFFSIVTGDSKGEKMSREKMLRFFRALGHDKLNLAEVENILEDLKGKIFYAEVEISSRNGKEFINVHPIKFGGTMAPGYGGEGEEAPF